MPSRVGAIAVCRVSLWTHAVQVHQLGAPMMRARCWRVSTMSPALVDMTRRSGSLDRTVHEREAAVGDDDDARALHVDGRLERVAGVNAEARVGHEIPVLAVVMNGATTR